MIDRRQLIGMAVATAAGPTLALAAPRPDLTGTWTNAWYTHLERPKEFKGLVATPAEAEAFEAPRRALRGELLDSHDTLGQAESEFPDNGPGMARIRGEIRSSWITDPPDGRVPWRPEVLERRKADHEDNYDNVEARPTDERCLTVPGAAAPLINSHDADLIQIVQTEGWLVIAGEKNHETRAVRIGPPQAGPRADWMGASTGRWEGATLVVETTGLRPGLTKISDELSLTERSRVLERFTRTGPKEITYLFEVEDPNLFTRAWKGEMVFRAAEGRLFEYACHEGNYSLPSILSAARQADAGR